MTARKEHTKAPRREWPTIKKTEVRKQVGCLTPRTKITDPITGASWLYLPEQWEARQVKLGDDECWGWKGAYHRQGYALFIVLRENDAVQSGPTNAQRFAMALHLGRPLVKGERVSATCHNPACTNPKHLFITDYKGQFKNSGQVLTAASKRKKWLPDYFLAHMNDFETLGPLRLSRKLGITEGEASSAKFAFNKWVNAGMPFA